MDRKTHLDGLEKRIFFTFPELDPSVIQPVKFCHRLISRAFRINADRTPSIVFLFGEDKLEV
jgi:hypothetical protein